MDSSYERQSEGSLPVLGADGRLLRITLHMTYFVLTGRDGSRARLPRRGEIELDDGSPVELVDDGANDEFRIVATGEILRLAK
jgi:hypothetical protein